jgi:hypothetical protein
VDFGPGSVVLVGNPKACPDGWTVAGQAALSTSPEFVPADGQTQSPLGVTSAATIGWQNTSFFVCVKG